jgi:hypothetical protein
MDEPVKATDFRFRPLTSVERQALIERTRRELPELDRQFALAGERLRRIAEGKFPTRPPQLR